MTIKMVVVVAFVERILIGHIKAEDTFVIAVTKNTISKKES